MPDPTLERRLRPRRVPRQARSNETRARILDAARTVFAQHGYAAGTTNRIADEASMSVGSLYQYFPNKDAILVELVNEHVEESATALASAASALQAVDGPDELVSAIRSVVTTLADQHALDHRLHQVLFEESPRPPSLLRRLRELEDRAVTVAANALTAAGAGGDDPSLRARIAVVTIESLIHRLIATERPLHADEVVDEITRLLSAYLVA